MRLAIPSRTALLDRLRGPTLGDRIRGEQVRIILRLALFRCS